MNDAYALIANHLKDIHFTLTEKILSNKRNMPQWNVIISTKTPLVAELAPLQSVILVLERLAGQEQRDDVTIQEGFSEQ